MNGTLMLFSIFDQAADAFMRPWVAPTKAVALRMFSDMANDPEHEISKHSGDYCLFCVGTFCEDTAELNPAKESLGFAVEYQHSQNQPVYGENNTP